MYTDSSSRRPPSSSGYAGAGSAGGCSREPPQEAPSRWLYKVCDELRRVDQYHRGLLSGAAFSKALEALGLKYGTPEVDAILEHCTITGDGYVHYKQLLQLLAPEAPRAKQSHAKGAIFPREEGEDFRDGVSTMPDSVVSGGNGSLGSGPVPADDIRPIFAQWEKGRLSSPQFKAELQKRGVDVTDAFERLVLVHGASRAVPFGKVLAALQIDENDGRRARNALGCLPSGRAHAGGSSFLPDRGGEPAVGSHERKSRVPPHDGSGASGLSTPAELDHHAGLRRAVVDFIDGRIFGVAFRNKLGQCGIPVSPALERLIRRHEGDGSVRFQDLARVLPLGGGSSSSVSAPLVHSSAGYAQADGYARSETSSVSAPSAARLEPTVPPFATLSDTPYQRYDAQMPQELPPDRRRRSTDNGREGAGGAGARLNPRGADCDIIGWRGNHEEALAPTTQQQWEPGLVGDLLQTQSRPPESQASAHHGKRFYNQAPHAGEKAPFGRECDIRPRGSRPDPIATPFGTERDVHAGRPEHAGTQEYRAAIMPGRGRVH
jgi:hypothetical protein